MDYSKYKKVSLFLMPFNCIFGMGILASFMTHWYYFILPLSLFILNMWFFDKTHKLDLLKMGLEFEEMKKTHDYMGQGEYGDTDWWKNKETGELIEK